MIKIFALVLLTWTTVVSAGTLQKRSTEDVTNEIEERGSLYTSDYRCYIKGPQGFISPWHDIPLFYNEKKVVYNMVVEIPRWTNAKMEMTTRDPLTPIRQDKSGDIVRFVNNVFPHRGYIWNYGALPQTWENNTYVDPNTGATGDNDPIDAIDIGSVIHRRGAVIQVKLVGCLALVDGGETDWKLVVIDVNDPIAKKVDSMKDVEKYFPGLTKATIDWFRKYKIPTGKPANKFAFDGEFKDAKFCNKIVDETYTFWKSLVEQPNPTLNTLSRREGAVHYASAANAAAVVAATPAARTAAAIPEIVDKWLYIPDDTLKPTF